MGEFKKLWRILEQQARDERYGFRRYDPSRLFVLGMLELYAVGLKHDLFAEFPMVGWEVRSVHWELGKARVEPLWECTTPIVLRDSMD
jgi:hypothetical protein